MARYTDSFTEGVSGAILVECTMDNLDQTDAALHQTDAAHQGQAICIQPPSLPVIEELTINVTE